MISKLQRVVCHLNDRLSAVEQISGIAPPAIVPASTGEKFAVPLCAQVCLYEKTFTGESFYAVPHKKDKADEPEEKGSTEEGASEIGRKRLQRKR
jgi:hypothetical protein